MRAYLDSAPIIYLVERHPVFGPRVEAWLTANPCDLVSSDLARMEVLVLPTRNGDLSWVADFEDFFRLQVVEMVGFVRAVFDRAIEIRATHNFQTPDSLHLAAAVESACDRFLTTDHRLAAFTGIRVELI